MKTALVLVDLQNDYFPGGSMVLEGAEAAGGRAAQALAFFRGRGLPVVHVQHVSARPGATFFLPGTPGADFHEGVRPLPGEVVFEKHFPNGFRDTPLLGHLRDQGIGRLAVAGMMTSMCVDATVRAAFDHGFENVLLHDAMATRALSFGSETIPARLVHGAFLAALAAVYGTPLTVGEYLARAPGELERS